MDFLQYTFDWKTVQSGSCVLFLTLQSGVQSDKDSYDALASSLCVLGATYIQLSKEGSIFIADLLWAT